MPTRKRKKSRKIKVKPWAAAGIAAGIIASIFLASLLWKRDSQAETGAKVPKGVWRYGIDISHNNQKGIVWDSLFVMTDSKGRTVRDAGNATDIMPVSFVFIKATEGASHKDPDFKDNWKDAGRTGLRRGAYHFFRSSKDGELQARNFISTVGDLRFRDLPPVLDIETIHAGCSKELLNRRAIEWLKAVEKHYGKKPVVYSGSSFIKDNLSKEITSNYPVWVAHYGKESPAYDGWTWWQFTDKAVVRGVPGKVDLSVTRVD